MRPVRPRRSAEWKRGAGTRPQRTASTAERGKRDVRSNVQRGKAIPEGGGANGVSRQRNDQFGTRRHSDTEHIGITRSFALYWPCASAGHQRKSGPTPATPAQLT